MGVHNFSFKSTISTIPPVLFPTSPSTLQHSIHTTIQTQDRTSPIINIVVKPFTYSHKYKINLQANIRGHSTPPGSSDSQSRLPHQRPLGRIPRIRTSTQNAHPPNLHKHEQPPAYPNSTYKNHRTSFQLSIHGSLLESRVCPLPIILPSHNPTHT
ncbi:hypothetical protein PGT21_032686 [Puccinia graminis f. sp. tritici]|uniref:Uncharacterized protein n=1 Tax=Puccinia graminis f. sp. tritici TaxID=56615 RepID=A0A5B0MH01_PUCGR|nr:hypothetical protein PGT21_032686 [Puccinia graminis f. sp. tritici]